MIRAGLRAFTLAASVSASVLASAGAAQAEDAAAFYRTHVVRFIAGGGPGGGYDNYARMIAPHLASALGGTVVVDNESGAGGLVALNRITATETEGLQFIIMNGGGAVLSQLFELKTVRYDLANAPFLATVSSSPWLVLVDPKSATKTMADLKAAPLVRFPATGPIDGLSDGASMVCEAFRLKCRIVLGYKSSNEGSLAVARGEMDALYVSDTSANAYVKSGVSRAIAVVARARTRFLPDMPTVFEQGGLDETQDWWLKARADIDALGRVVLASPKAPPERIAYLQEVFRKVLTDPALLKEGERLQRYVDWESGEATRARALSFLRDMPAERKAALRDVVMKKYLAGAD